MKNCTNCGQKTSNPKFCSSSCSTKFNNKKPRNRMKPQGECKGCKKPCKKYRILCSKCAFRGKDMTLAEATYLQVHPANAYSIIRYRAKVQIIKAGLTFCQLCGYNKHVEVCHIKPISTFSSNTLISIINADKNLCALCPNCHWEFDRGLINFP